jgi:phosphotriesterase-related protein
MGAGWSTHLNAHTAWVDARSVEELSDYLLRDVREGDPDTGIRPGVLGEIGTSKVVCDCEERVLRACARVSAQTDYPVLVHTELPEIEEAMRIIDIATSEGMDPGRLVLGHMDYNVGDPVYYIRLLRRGVSIAIDSFGMILHFEPWSDVPTERDYERWNRTTDDDRIDTVVELIHAGFEDQLVLGQDVSFKVQWKRFGGYGYDHLLSRVLPRLQRKFGVPDAVVKKFLVDNPGRLLATAE